MAADRRSPTSTSTTAVAPKVTGDVTVSAAASLKETFTQIGKDFESANPGAKVTINFGSSGDLATQIQSGAPVDVAAFVFENVPERLTLKRELFARLAADPRIRGELPATAGRHVPLFPSR